MPKSNFPNRNNRATQLSKNRNGGGQVELIAHASYQGPLPPPDALRKYEDIVPGAAERIIKMAETQSSHRQDLERKIIEQQGNEENREYDLSERGQHYSLIVVILCLIGAVICILKGQTIAGTILGGVPMASLVYAFIYGHKKTQAAEKK